MEQELRRAAGAGARFALATGLGPRLLDRAAGIGLPSTPGAMTSSDLPVGIERGVQLFRFFPAMPAGGVAFLRSIAAPFGLRAPRLIPTGGVLQGSLVDWLGGPSVAAVGGTWIASRTMIRDGDRTGIRRAAGEVLRAVRVARERS